MLGEIATSAWQAQQRKVNLPKEPFLCLKLVRRIIEHAYYNGREVFYEKYGVTRTTQERPRLANGEKDWSWYASDIEASAKQLGFAIKYEDRRPGDIVFNWEAARPYGHVAILVDKNTLIENVNPSYRSNSLVVAPYTCLTRVQDLGYTLCARFPKL